MPDDAAAGWLFLDPERLPDRWRDRARPAVFVPLIAQEVEDLLTGRLQGPALNATEQQLAELVARGRSVPAISRLLGVSPRTVERRLAVLRERFGVGSSVDLALELAGRGLGQTNQPVVD